jgi:Pumilio-family RNA binding repeat
MQKYIKNASPATIEKIIEEIKDELGDLFSSDFSNYFCQKLIQFTNTE